MQSQRNSVGNNFLGLYGTSFTERAKEHDRRWQILFDNFNFIAFADVCVFRLKPAGAGSTTGKFPIKSPLLSVLILVISLVLSQGWPVE